MADQTPKLIFYSEKPKATWNAAVQFIDFYIENPHKIVNEMRFTSKYVGFETNHKRSKIFLSTHATHGAAGIFVNHVID
jgi:hypothetical protein